jgi:hypothetical protein
VTVDLQQRRCGDGDAAARTVGAPQAEIVVKPISDESEVHPFERRFESDLALSLLDFELDQLQPNGTLA